MSEGNIREAGAVRYNVVLGCEADDEWEVPDNQASGMVCGIIQSVSRYRSNQSQLRTIPREAQAAELVPTMHKHQSQIRTDISRNEQDLSE